MSGSCNTLECRVKALEEWKAAVCKACGTCEPCPAPEPVPEPEPSPAPEPEPNNGEETCPPRPPVNDSRIKWVACYNRRWCGIYKKADRYTYLKDDGSWTSFIVGLPVDFPPQSEWIQLVPDPVS